MKKQFLVLLALMISVAASADPTREQLESDFKAQAGWSQGSAQASGFQGDLKIFKTQRGSVRLAEAPDVLRGNAVIWMPDKAKLGAAFMKSWCDSMSGAYRASKGLRTRYALKMQLNPLSSATPVVVSGQPVTVENRQLWTRFTPQIEFGQGSAVATETHIDMAAFRAAMAPQITAQKAQIDSTGLLQLDLTGWDDVACDLALGTAKLKFEMAFAYEAPMVRRNVVINARDLDVLYRGTKPMIQSPSALIGAMSLGASMATQLKRTPDSFAADDLTRLYGQLFDVKSGALLNLDQADFTKLSYDLDQLMRGPNVQTISIEDRVSIATH